MRTLLTSLLVLAAIAPAAASDLKLLTAGAFKSVALELVPEFEKKTSHKVTVENDTAGAVARLLSHRVMVMKEGRVIETGLTDQVLDDPREPYTQLLVSSILPA